jgi:hypothetical protein
MRISYRLFKENLSSYLGRIVRKKRNRQDNAEIKITVLFSWIVIAPVRVYIIRVDVHVKVYTFECTCQLYRGIGPRSDRFLGYSSVILIQIALYSVYPVYRLPEKNDVSNFGIQSSVSDLILIDRMPK